MKKQKKQWTAILLCVLMALLVAACGKEEKEAAAEEPAAEEPAAVSEEAQETAEEETEASEEAPAEEVISEEEAEAAAEEEIAGTNMLAVKAPMLTGLENVKNTNNEDGTYYYEDMAEDAVTFIVNMCAPSSFSEDDASQTDYATRFMEQEVKPACKVTKAEMDEALSAKTTYSVCRLHWEWGENEDTTWGDGVVIMTDNFTYYYGYQCPADYYEENEEFFKSQLDETELIDLSGN